MSTAIANVAIDDKGSRVALASFGFRKAAGAFSIATGIGVRDLLRGRSRVVSSSFLIPCSTTILAPDQYAYVYIGGFTDTLYGRERLTEIGIQMNPPRGGGRPTSVQVYARRSGGNDDTTLGANLHLRCNSDVTVRFGLLDSDALAATFSGSAIPLASHRLTIVERLAASEQLDTTPTGDLRIERVTALAVPAGSAFVRRGTKLAVSTGSQPDLAFVRDHDFQPPSSIDAPRVIERRAADRTSVGIDEREAP